jgi:hypothetical protein
MTVAELIEYLKTQPQNMQVALECYSEFCLLDEEGIQQYTACEPRPDGWIHIQRQDKPARTYVLLHGK